MKKSKRMPSRKRTTTPAASAPQFRENVDGVVRDWNAGAVALYGYTEDEMIGKSVGALYPEGLMAREQVLSRVLDSDNGELIRVVHRTKDGRHLNVALDVSPLRDARGAVESVVTVVRESTETPRSDENFWDSDVWVRNIVETAVDAIVTIDKNGIIEYFNPAAQRMFGYTADEVRGRNVNILMPTPYQENHQGYLEAYQRSHVKKIIGIGREVVAKRKDGTVFPIHLSVSETAIEGEQLFTGIIHDITKQKRAQVEKDNLLRVLDQRNKEITCLLRVNELVRLPELSPPVLADIGELIRSSLSYPDIARVRIAFNDDVHESPDFRESDWTITASIAVDGRIRGRIDVFYVENRPDADYGPFLEEEQILVESVAVTLGEAIELKEAEAKVIHASKLASVGELAAGVGHEVNNPTNSIMNCADIILQYADDADKVRQFAGLIRSEAERIATIVRNLLTFSRQDREQHSLGRLCDIVDVVLSLSEKKLERSNIEVRLDVPEDLPKLRCRSEQLQQVVMNLIINALHALDQRYPDDDPDKILTIAGRSVDDDGKRYVRLTVEDHGCGVAPDNLDKIFDPFYTTKGRDKGTGLGLSVSLGIVEEHNGRIQVESELDRYTRFHVDIPAGEEEELGQT